MGCRDFALSFIQRGREMKQIWQNIKMFGGGNTAVIGIL